MEHLFEGKKLSEEGRKKVYEVLKKLHERYGDTFSWHETPDIITVRFEDPSTKKMREIGFTKIEEIPIANQFWDIEKVIEATICYPDNVEEGILRIEEEDKKTKK